MATMPKEVLDAFTERSMKCTEALSGIPDAWLKDAKKAMLAYRLIERYGFKGLVERAKDEREKKGQDFGPELNALLDSLKE